MFTIENSLKYLRESLSNYVDIEDISQRILTKLEAHDYDSEDEFIEELDEDEIEYLNHLLENEISYAHDAQDEVRVKELNDIYELLI